MNDCKMRYLNGIKLYVGILSILYFAWLWLKQKLFEKRETDSCGVW